MNGLYGLRPSYGRIPYEGVANTQAGQDSLPSVIGPLSSSLTGIKAFMRAVLSMNPWFRDPLVVPKAWSEDEYQLSQHGRGKKLSFGILWSDGEVVPHPPVIRALEMTKKALIAAGHEGDFGLFFNDSTYISLSITSLQFWIGNPTNTLKYTT